MELTITGKYNKKRELSSYKGTTITPDHFQIKLQFSIILTPVSIT